MATSGRAARQVLFARDAPWCALALIPVDGVLCAHSWNTHTGEIVRSTDGEIRDPAITPDGQWLWWFDYPHGRLWRRPFGSSPRGRLEPPLRLRPLAGTRVLPGGDGTAIVSRPLTQEGITLSLLPIGRVRPGAEPVLIAQVPHLRSLMRSYDDALVGVDTGAEIAVYRAHSGQLVAAHRLEGTQRAIGFTADGSIALVRVEVGGEPAPMLDSLMLWDPQQGFHRSVALDALPHPTRAVVAHHGRHVLVECRGTATGASAGAFLVHLDGSAPEFLGPASGAIVAGTLTPAGEEAVYGVWASDTAPERLIRVSPAPPDGRTDYPPVVGGIGW